ncbi:TRAP transporter small permease subunit [Pseudahrensia aquimaris]|uniref:TRAP transporter small permease protein n=1 Tax=Pseudahrensia aquimaris TaxID=744461 RepID=A0ABW3FEV8_9HYPH
MSSTSLESNSDLENAGAANDGKSALARMFGWSLLAFLFAWFINNILKLSFDWPGAAAFLTGQNVGASLAQAVFVVAAIAVAILFVKRRPNTTLRQDAATISGINTFLVRAAFFVVLFVGIGDMVISFLRVEGMLDAVVGSELAKDFGRAQVRGVYVHMPLMALGILVACFSRTLGFHWLALLIVGAELAIVLTRFVFSYEQSFMGDLVRFWYAALFLFASAYTLLEEGHVRVDVFYSTFKNRTKGIVNAVGSLVLGIGFCWTILLMGLGNKSAIVYSPVANFEVSQSGFGMYVKYMMAGFLAFFAITMMIQFISYLLESIADWREEPGTRLGSQSTAAH